MNFSRPEQLQELDAQTESDLLIIGGGIVGSAALQMASSAGLKSILLEKCFKHYCVAKPTDYMLRRTHISWFNENGGKNEIKKIVTEFQLTDAENETLEELKNEGLLG